MLTDLTERDRLILDQLCIARLHNLLEPLQLFTLFLDLEHTLNIYCSTEIQVNSLLELERELKRQSWLTLGCTHIRIWQERSPVWESNFSDELQSISLDLEGKEMPVVSSRPVDTASPIDTIQQAAAQVLEPTLDRVVDQEVRNYLQTPAARDLIQSKVEERMRFYMGLGSEAEETQIAQTNGKVATAEPAPAKERKISRLPADWKFDPAEPDSSLEQALGKTTANAVRIATLQGMKDGTAIGKANLTKIINTVAYKNRKASKEKLMQAIDRLLA